MNEILRHILQFAKTRKHINIPTHRKSFFLLRDFFTGDNVKAFGYYCYPVLCQFLQHWNFDASWDGIYQLTIFISVQLIRQQNLMSGNSQVISQG